MTAIRATLGERVSEMILPGELRAMILAVFDRTFLVTYLMEAVAVRSDSSASAPPSPHSPPAAARNSASCVIWVCGAARSARCLALEAALTAAVGVGVGLLAGGAIALVLIEVINRQSFRWSMDLQLPFVAAADLRPRR